jgi:hypothetical protein
MPRQFTPETAIFETIDTSDKALPRKFGEFANGARTGHCCAPCACRALMDMAERSASRTPRSQQGL